MPQEKNKQPSTFQSNRLLLVSSQQNQDQDDKTRNRTRQQAQIK